MSGGLEPPSRLGLPSLEQVLQSGGGSVCGTQKHSLVLHERMGQPSARVGCVCTLAMALDALYTFPPILLIPQVLG